MEKIFEVIKKDGVTGLTVGNGLVLKPGERFTEKQWNYTSDSLAAAVKDGRCKEVSRKEDPKAEAKAKDKQ